MADKKHHPGSENLIPGGTGPGPGLPLSYTDKLADEIVDRISQGETLPNICKDDHMPKRETVLHWTRTIPSFLGRYAQARKDQQVAWADEIISLADDAISDYKVKVALDDPLLKKITRNGEVEFRYDKKHVDRVREQIRARQWLMERVNSEEFGLHQRLDVMNVLEEQSDEELVDGFETEALRAGFPEELVKMVIDFITVSEEETVH